MKLFGVLALFLMMSPAVTINAQNSNTTRCASVLPTGAECDPVGAIQRKLNHTNRNVNKLQGQVKTLRNQETQRDKKVAGMQEQEATDRGDINDTKAAVNNQRSTVSALEDRVSELSKTMQIVIVAGVILLLGGAGYLAWWLKRFRRRHRQDLEYLEDRISAREVVIINPTKEYLRGIWEDSKGKAANDRVIHFTERLVANHRKGYSSGGDVDGYTAIFEEGAEYPTIRYKDGPVIRLDNVAAHAAKVLGLPSRNTPSTQ